MSEAEGVSYLDAFQEILTPNKGKTYKVARKKG